MEKRLTGNKIEDSSHLGCYAKQMDDIWRNIPEVTNL